jgi:lauroyl/myristoyl acyltransferase
VVERLAHGIAYWLWRVGAALVQRLPAGFVYACAVIGGEITYLVWTTKREIAKHNVAVVLGRPQATSRWRGSHGAASATSRST